jgi:CTP:molybdopterin cytidylyltransferase MocA
MKRAWSTESSEVKVFGGREVWTEPRLGTGNGADGVDGDEPERGASESLRVGAYASSSDAPQEGHVRISSVTSRVQAGHFMVLVYKQRMSNCSR